jgi:hypothetical protein
MSEARFQNADGKGRMADGRWQMTDIETPHFVPDAHSEFPIPINSPAAAVGELWPDC